MDLIHKIGQLFMLGFEGIRHGSAWPAIDQLHCGGVILFGHNLASPEQVVDLTGALQERAQAAGLPPLLISVDQEGGRVARLGSVFMAEHPSNLELGKDFTLSSDSSPVSRQGTQTAAVLLGLGINMNLAPVLDVVTVHGNEVIGDRAYASDASIVSRLGVEYINAMQAAGVIATAKHFPGHGPTTVDSHFGLPIVKLEEAEFRNQHLAPFVAAINAGVEAIMPAHIIYPSWDEWPTTLSQKLLTELLRNELGYQGIIITDDLNMHAIAKHYSYPGSLVQALAAGVDILLVCTDPVVQQAAVETVVKGVKDGSLHEELIDTAVARVMNLKQKYGLVWEETA